jgi:hypothetical protein
LCNYKLPIATATYHSSRATFQHLNLPTLQLPATSPTIPYTIPTSPHIPPKSSSSPFKTGVSLGINLNNKAMDINNITGNKYNGKIVAGIIILVIGSILLIQQFNFFFFPHWLFSWPMWMIGYGVYIGAKHNFRKAIWLWLVVLGTAFLITQNVDDAGRFIFPVSIIGLGGWMIMRHNEKNGNKTFSGTH